MEQSGIVGKKQEEKLVRNRSELKFVILYYCPYRPWKSTLADRIIQKTGLLTEREMQDQVLDNMDSGA